MSPERARDVGHAHAADDPQVIHLVTEAVRRGRQTERVLHRRPHPGADGASWHDFLAARLAEEFARAEQRRRAGVAGPGEADASERGLRLLTDLLLDLRTGVPPDALTLELLVMAYGEHPDFPAT